MAAGAARLTRAFRPRRCRRDLALTDREADVLREVGGGGTIADTAHSLGLSQGTVRNHVSSSMLKMDARTRAEAASWPAPPAGCRQATQVVSQ